jgi:hypothetical protein
MHIAYHIICNACETHKIANIHHPIEIEIHTLQSFTLKINFTCKTMWVVQQPPFVVWQFNNQGS